MAALNGADRSDPAPWVLVAVAPFSGAAGASDPAPVARIATPHDGGLGSGRVVALWRAP